MRPTCPGKSRLTTPGMSAPTMPMPAPARIEPTSKAGNDTIPRSAVPIARTRRRPAITRSTPYRSAKAGAARPKIPRQRTGAVVRMLASAEEMPVSRITSVSTGDKLASTRRRLSAAARRAAAIQTTRNAEGAAGASSRRCAARSAAGWSPAVTIFAEPPLAAIGAFCRVAQRGIDQSVGDPPRDALDLLCAAPPDIAQHHIGFDAIDHRERAHQTRKSRLAELRSERARGVAEDLHAMPTAVGLLHEFSRSSQCRMLERQLQGGAQLRLILFEARESPDEQFPNALASVRYRRGQAADRAEAVLDHRRDQFAAARKIAIGRCARHAGARGNLGDRGHFAIAEHGPGLAQEKAQRSRFWSGARQKLREDRLASFDRPGVARHGCNDPFRRSRSSEQRRPQSKSNAFPGELLLRNDLHGCGSPPKGRFFARQ